MPDLTGHAKTSILAAGVAITMLAMCAVDGAADPTGRRSAPLYVDTELDPDDVPVDPGSCCQQDPDIRSTTRKVAVDDGRRSLFITFRSFESLVGYWTVSVPLDTRGGGRIDARMRIHDSGVGPTGCGVRFLAKGPRRRGRLSLPLVGDRATCRVPLAWVHPNKRIRWKLISRAGVEGSEPGVDEYAPDDHGWFG